MWQRRKEKSLIPVFLWSLLLVICFTLRFVPMLNDAISGKPEYMRWLADRVARSIASQYGNDATIIAVREETRDCRQPSDVTVSNPDDLYYVVSYSEMAHSLCFLTYASLPSGWGRANSIVLYPKVGRDYGRRLDSPIRAVPVAHVQMIFPAAYLSLLHWRSKIDPSSFARAANSKIERWFANSPQPVSSVDVSIDFAALRADVGRRHRSVNQALTIAMFAGVCLILLGGYKTWICYYRFRAFLARYPGQVDFLDFLSRDLRVIASEARAAHEEEQKRAVEQARAAILSKRSKEAIRGRLEVILGGLTDAQERLRVQESLSRDDVEEMKALAQELLGHAGQKTPEERLTALLDTLKQYCNGEEFDRFCAEAFRILATTGFREARSFVVATHDQLRARSRELEEQESVEMDDRLVIEED